MTTLATNDTARLLAVHRPVQMPRPQPVVRVRQWWATTAAVCLDVLAVIDLRTRALVPTVTSASGSVQVWRDGRELMSPHGSAPACRQPPRCVAHESRKPMRRGFTLVELLVVLSVIVLALGALMPGISVMKKHSDLYSTANTLLVVHGAQQRCARQFGSAGVIYGYTINYTSNTASGLPLIVKGADNVKPWLVDINGQHKDNTPPDYDLQSDIGKQLIWNTTSKAVNFTDAIKPANQIWIGAAATPIPTGSQRWLHVALMPRTGLMYAKLTDNQNPTSLGGATTRVPANAPAFTVSELTKPTATWMDAMGSLKIELWDIRDIDNKVTPVQQRGYCYVSSTGAFEVRSTE